MTKAEQQAARAKIDAQRLTELKAKITVSMANCSQEEARRLVADVAAHVAHAKAWEDTRLSEYQAAFANKWPEATKND
jgi:hypothetical protein